MATATLSRPRTGGSPRPTVRRRRRWPVWLAVALVLALLGTGVWLLAFSSVLATSYVAVSGTAVLSDSEVRKVAAVPVGLPLARQDLDAVAHRVAVLAPVESVRVDRRWPDTVAIEVTERTGVVAVRAAAGYAVVDRFGVAFQTAGSVPEGVVLAQVPTGNTPALVEVGRVAGALPAKLRRHVSMIRAQSVITVTVVLDDGVPVTWGTSADTALKSEIVLALRKHARTYRSIDVSSPHNAATR